MTDAEVDAMARGGGQPLAQRIAKHSPSKRTGKLSDEKVGPLDMTNAEMLQIQRRRGLPKALREELRERLRDAAPSDEAGEPLSSPKESPKRQPGP